MNYYDMISIGVVFDSRPEWEDAILIIVFCISIGLMNISKLIPLLK